MKMLLGLIVDTPKSNPKGFAQHQKLLAEKEKKQREELLHKRRNNSANKF